MAFTDQYKKEDFLAVLDSNPKATTVIAKKIGCARNTAKKFLAELEAEGKVKQVEIEGGFYAWIKSTKKSDSITIDEIDGVIDENGCLHVDGKYAGKKVKILIYKEKKEP